ncbi:MAG: DUF2076 domain-containing protein [Alphaproteobacteria bacterium]|nr:DUF2076 domain-containing protein [Alphaproteobacteria bacterium]MCW5742097.1 DUF2076 domain-containing protein [Alphaproteobacteria bacterium]
MTPQEKDMITQLLDRLKQAGGQPKDPEAEALIRQAVQAQPDAPYLLVQTALIQNMSLEGAQARIAELEREVAAAKQAAGSKPTSFLGGLLGGGSQPAPQPAQPMARPGSVPQTGGYGQQPPPGYAPQQAGPIGGGGSSFLRTAAVTAAGVAGGALLYHGISSMFSGGHGAGGASQSFMGGGAQQAGASPWGNAQGAGSDEPLTAERDQGYDSGAASDAGGWDDSGDGFSLDEEF